MEVLTLGANGNKETISDDKGLNTDDQQKSVNLGNNDSLNGDLSVELDRTYVLNSKTGETITGLELQKLANQGKLSRELQSRLDKTTAEHKTIVDENARLKQEREQLIVKATIADSFIQGKPTQQTEMEPGDDFLWEDEGIEPKKTVTKPVNLRNRNENSSQVPNEIINEVKSIRDELQDIKAERKQTADQVELERIAKFVTERKFVAIKTKLPDIGDTELRRIIQTEDTAERLNIEAMNKRLSGDVTFADDLAQSVELVAKARDSYVEAVKRQEIVSIRRDNDTSVEGSSPVDGPIPMPEGFKWSSNPDIAKIQMKEFSEKNKAQSKLRRRAVL